MAKKQNYKYLVIGGKTKGKTGKVLSRHHNLEQARKSASQYAKKGYSGAISKRMKTKPRSRVHKYFRDERGYHKAYWYKSVGFSPDRPRGLPFYRRKR